MLACQSSEGKVVAIHLVHLTQEAKKAEASEKRPTKQTIGPLGSGAVRLPGRGEPLLVGEGPETALSAWIPTGRETWTAAGRVGHVALPPGRPVIALADDDPVDAPATLVLASSVKEWTEAGHRVAVVGPRDAPKGDKADFNDLLAKGHQSVSRRIEGCVRQLM
jgi:hypothetical protein